MRRVISHVISAGLLALLPACSAAPVEESEGAITTNVAQPTLCPVPPVAPCLNDDTCSGRFSVGDKKVPYYRNYALANPNPAIERALILVHGVTRNVRGAFKTALDSAQLAVDLGTDSCAPTSTLILAPHFQNEDDEEVALDELFWSASHWSEGNRSINEGNHVSSFAVVDQLVETVANSDKFPNLTEITIAGHSAGGQFTQRYAAGNRVEQTLRSGLSMRYVVTNASSYLYPSSVRWVPGSPATFAPVYWCFSGQCFKSLDFATLPDCPDYNVYKYGMGDLNGYMQDTGAAAIRAQYQARDVTYLLGQDDTELGDAPSSQLDTSCEARYQGIHRLERGRVFMKYMNQVYPNNQHTKLELPGVGHSAHDMFTTFAGMLQLFPAQIF